MNKLNINNHIVFFNKDIDIFGNTSVSQYYIYKFQNELRIVYKYNSVTRHENKGEFCIKDINTVKETINGNVIIPGFISIGDSLEGEYKEGYSFRFDNILQYEILDGGYNNEEEDRKFNRRDSR